MSVVETIRGLRKMSVADGAATPPPSPRNPQPISVAAVVEGLGGLEDGLRAILMEYWRSDIIPKYPPEWLEARNVVKGMSDKR